MKMRAVLFVCACAWYSVLGQDINAMKDMPKYDARYDYLDIDAILDSKRLVKNYVECLINQYRCTPEGKALKRILPEALRTKCVRCTENQKRTAVKVIKRLKYEYPEEWAKLSSRWDPTGDFTKYFEQVLAKEPFNTIYGYDDGAPVSPTPPPPPPPTVPPSPVPSVEPLPSSSPPPQPTPQPPVDGSTEAKPAILNRFGEEGELMTGSPSMGSPTAAPKTPSPSPPAPTMPTMYNRPIPMRPITLLPRPGTTIIWTGVASDPMPTRFPLRPFQTMPPAYTTAITLIDQIGYKIMRTTELVTDILRNTVRAVVG